MCYAGLLFGKCLSTDCSTDFTAGAFHGATGAWNPPVPYAISKIVIETA
ncbi:hypothetical protein BDK61_1622 [Haloarcula quadrata]|uniref:Uncharacterized protein n=1 Tax=Haloarcula quadrata TaxID=182779 RepID=A0A495R523_9EURY|nr:hypothetical protein BDK61_1622 [Haloarcula quadrata]